MKDKLIEKLSSLIPEDLTEEQSTKLFSFMEESLKNAPGCNKCGILLDGDRNYGTVKVSIHWGFESTGKDGDCDKWRLCEPCADEFREKYDPICSICGDSIIHSMAELDAHNPRRTFYGDYPAAVARLRTSRHCGLEYANISGRIVCEICYEAFISEFKIPIQAGSYEFLSGNYREGKGEQRKDRIEATFAYECTEDALSHMFRAKPTYDDVVEIRSLVDKEKRAVGLSYRRDKPEFLERLKKRNPDTKGHWQTVGVQAGDNKYVRVPLSWLQEQAEAAGVIFDPTKLSIKDQGATLVFGDLLISAEEAIDKWAKEDEEGEPQKAE